MFWICSRDQLCQCFLSTVTDVWASTLTLWTGNRCREGALSETWPQMYWFRSRPSIVSQAVDCSLGIVMSPLWSRLKHLWDGLPWNVDTDINAPQRMNLKDFGDPVTFPPASPWGRLLWFWLKQLLGWVALNFKSPSWLILTSSVITLHLASTSGQTLRFSNNLF